MLVRKQANNYHAITDFSLIFFVEATLSLRYVCSFLRPEGSLRLRAERCDRAKFQMQEHVHRWSQQADLTRAGQRCESS